MSLLSLLSMLIIKKEATKDQTQKDAVQYFVYLRAFLCHFTFPR